MVKFSLWCCWWLICLFSSIRHLALCWAALIFFLRIWHKFQWGRSGKESCSDPVACSKWLDISYDNLFSGLVYHATPLILFCSFNYKLSPPPPLRPQYLGCWKRASPLPTEMPMVALRVLTGSLKAEGCPLFITSPFFQHIPSKERDVRNEKREWIVKKSGWVTHLHEVHTQVTHTFIE